MWMDLSRHDWRGVLGAGIIAGSVAGLVGSLLSDTGEKTPIPARPFLWRSRWDDLEEVLKEGEQSFDPRDITADHVALWHSRHNGPLTDLQMDWAWSVSDEIGNFAEFLQVWDDPDTAAVEWFNDRVATRWAMLDLDVPAVVKKWPCSAEIKRYILKVIGEWLWIWNESKMAFTGRADHATVFWNRADYDLSDKELFKKTRIIAKTMDRLAGEPTHYWVAFLVQTELPPPFQAKKPGWKFDEEVICSIGITNEYYDEENELHTGDRWFFQIEKYDSFVYFNKPPPPGMDLEKKRRYLFEELQEEGEDWIAEVIDAEFHLNERVIHPDTELAPPGTPLDEVTEAYNLWPG